MTEPLPPDAGLRIVNVLFDDRFGGPQKRVIEVAERLAPRGIATTLCLPAGSGNAEEMARRARIKVRRLAFARIPRLSNVGRVVLWVLSLPQDVWSFAKLYRSERADIAHVNGAFFIAPALAARLVGVRLVWHLNDTIVPGVLRLILGGLVRMLATRVVVAAEAVALHYGVGRVAHSVLYAPVDVARFRSVRRNARLGRKSGPQVAVIANWNPAKGLETFVEAMALVRQRVSNIKIVFAGARIASHEAYAKRIDRKIEAHGLESVVSRLGFVEDVAVVLAETDLLVLSSVSEACPICVLEAMAAGVPVVATNVGGVRELLLADPARPAGEVVASRDPVAMAGAIVRLLTDRTCAAAFGDNGSYIAERRFDLNSCVARHERVYREVAAS